MRWIVNHMPRYPRWNDEEVSILKEDFPRLALDGKHGPINKKTIMDRLPKKTWDAIKWKAKQLGLRRDFRTVYDPLNISDVDRAYIAGYLDGEGCITVIRAKRKGGNINYVPYISIANKDLTSLEWIVSVTGLGRVRRLNKTPENKRTEKWRQRPWMWSDCYTYGVHNLASCYRFIKEIGPFLKVKKEHAELLLEIMEIMADREPSGSIRDPETGYFIRRLPTELTDREHEIHDRFRELNSRGWRSYK